MWVTLVTRTRNYSFIVESRGGYKSERKLWHDRVRFGESKKIVETRFDLTLNKVIVKTTDSLMTPEG
jgi:hypothetical protein